MFLLHRIEDRFQKVHEAVRTRPALMHYIEEPADLEASAGELFDVLKSGAVRIRVGNRHPLREAAEVHCAIGVRQTTGSTVLLPFA